MTISEKKMQIVIDNYFKSECDVNTSIRQAFEKGFRIGIKKLPSAQPEVLACGSGELDVPDGWHWVPCSERLPKKPDGYPNCEIRRTYFLVTLKSGCVKTLAYEFDRDE